MSLLILLKNKGDKVNEVRIREKDLREKMGNELGDNNNIDDGNKENIDDGNKENC